MKFKYILIFAILAALLPAGCQDNKWATKREDFNLEEADIKQTNLVIFERSRPGKHRPMISSGLIILKRMAMEYGYLRT